MMPVGQWLLLRPNKARLHLGDTGAVYPDDIAQMEAFARPLWAIVPMLAGHCASVKPLWAAWREGIIAGVDPENPEYWGEVVDYDQRLVEMAVFGMGMALAPKEFFFDLPEKTQKQLHAWLDQINRRDMPKNNWTFFHVLVNMGFIVCGMPHDEARMQKDFAMIEEHCEGDGWYEKTFPLAGIDGSQRVELGAHRTRTLTLDRLIKCDNPSAFPALRQIEVYGR